MTGRVTSPTFTIARRYESGPIPVSHLDLYRLAGADPGDPELLEEELGPDRIAFVEWPEVDARPARRARASWRACGSSTTGPSAAIVTIERAARA